MMIKLTWSADRNIKPIYINPNHIIMFYDNGSGSDIMTVNNYIDNVYPVLETPKEILELIREG